ncbi:chorismate synthase [Candidatus Uzinura diaspidicola str. ASNER]|uniref:Chorismate synthase n=1 Tax=Candidatus Uzinura diaspidicola str. ASNER TaxID=1133592 RepID=L7VK48_9FLAO|nr:chorismate synthase [Candidatus Uzinura diaspidicola str. ASNER]
MSGNSFGKIFTLKTYGESHGRMIGGIIDGCPSGLKLNLKKIQKELNRRKPGQSNIVTQRKEDDKVSLLSGILDGVTTGTPIGFSIENLNYKENDYHHIHKVYRPSHADFVYEKKYGIRDYRGGGRSSARETATRVVAGAIAKQLIKGIKITAFVSSVGSIHLNKPYHKLNLYCLEDTPVRCPDPLVAGKMIEQIKIIRKAGDTLGGVISCIIQGVPVGLGRPIFNKLHADLGEAMLSINAVKGFEYGSGFSSVQMRGSAHNDIFNANETTKTNFSGGIQGGLSNGMDIYFRVAFKPIATIMRKQNSIDIKGKISYLEGRGRHDPCVVPRAVPIVEAMTALVIADHWLLNKIIF